MQLISTVLSALAMSGMAVAAPATTPAPWASKDSSSGSYLVTFCVLWGGIGFGPSDPTEFIAYGKLGQCYNLEGPAQGSIDFEHDTGSVKPAAGTSCWIYKAADCQGTYTRVSAPKGDLLYEGNSYSFICVPTPASGSK